MNTEVQEDCSTDVEGTETKSSKSPFDGNLDSSLQAGFGALQQIFSGFARIAENAVGSEFVRNLQAAGWLGTVADCLDAIVAADGTGQVGSKVGELTCYAEQLETEVKDTRFASQLASFRTRLDAATGVTGKIAASNGTLSREESQVLLSAAGYFRAAAKSAIPMGAPVPEK